jgi:hypothetical protein
MELRLKTPVVALQAGEVLTLDDVEGASIKARCGTLWITQEGDLEDVVLREGEHFVVRHPGRTLVQAFDPAWVSIREEPLNVVH